MLTGVGLQKIAPDPSLEQFRQHILAIMHGEDQDFGPRQFLLDRTGEFKAVHHRQGIIEDGDVGPHFPDEFQFVTTIGRLSDNAPVGMSRQDGSNPKPDGFMVVRKDYPTNRAAHCPS